MKLISHNSPLLRCLPLAGCVVFVGLAPLVARAAPDDAEPPPVAQAENNGFEIAEVNFDQWVFPGVRNANLGREQIVTRMKLQISEIDRVCGLSEEQKRKLQLAGGGDTKRFFDEVEVVRRKFLEVRKDQNAFNNIWQEIQPLQAKMAAGLFGVSSLFAKTLRRTLSTEQGARYEAVENERRKYHYEAMVEAALAMLENSIPLRGEQHEALVKLLLEQTAPPAASGQQEYYYVMYRLATLPEEQVRPLVNDHQWDGLSQQFNQFRGLREFLVTSGMIAKADNDDQRQVHEPEPAGEAPQ